MSIKKLSVLRYIILWLTVSAVADPVEPLDPTALAVTWGKPTNEIWAGVNRETKQTNHTSFQEVRILIETTKTNGISSFFLSLGRKLAKFELRDANGTIVEPLPGKRPDAELPREIPMRDFPQSVSRGHHNRPGPLNRLNLSPNIPEIFWNIPIQSSYPIEKEGDYTLTTVVGLYYPPSAEATNVLRMDLPPVTVHLHLTP
jgi:hypothetical protein